MKKLVTVFVLSLPVCVTALSLSTKVERVVAKTVANNTVQVQVKLAKPVYMSDLMVRRPRCKDMVIRVDYKQAQCAGFLSSDKTYVAVPLSCVQDGKYQAERVDLAFADGTQVHKTAKSLQTNNETATIRL